MRAGVEPLTDTGCADTTTCFRPSERRRGGWRVCSTPLDGSPQESAPTGLGAIRERHAVHLSGRATPPVPCAQQTCVACTRLCRQRCKGGAIHVRSVSVRDKLVPNAQSSHESCPPPPANLLAICRAKRLGSGVVVFRVSERISLTSLHLLVLDPMLGATTWRESLAGPATACCPTHQESPGE